jgi:hypothetical protein
MTPNERHNLIAETKFRPYVEALLEGKQVEFKHNMNSTWRNLDLYTLVINNLSEYEFRFKPNYKELSDKLFKMYNILICKMSYISYKDALSKHISLVDVKFNSDKYIIPLNPYTLEPIETVEDYHKIPEN